MKVMRIMQGDAFSLPVEITLGGQVVTPEDVARIEVKIGGRIRKYYPDTGEYWGGYYLFPLTQEETLALPAEQRTPVCVRVKFTTGAVIGCRTKTMLEVLDGASGKEI